MPIVLHVNKRPYQFANKVIDKKACYEKINRYRNECGCASGVIFMTIALILLAVYLTMHWKYLDLMSYTFTGLLFIFMCTAAGKLLGMAIAKIRLSLLYKSLIEERYLELIE